MKSLSSLSLSWLPPTQSNADISGYFLELVSYDNTTVLQSVSVPNTLNYTFTGFSIGKYMFIKWYNGFTQHFSLLVAGVPYHVRVYAENVNGGSRGMYCTTTDFGDQLGKVAKSPLKFLCLNLNNIMSTLHSAPPNNILNNIVSSYETSDMSTALLTWTVLPIDQTKGFVTLTFTFDSQVNTTIKKRQISDESAECSQSPCQVSYHQGRVRILGLNSQRDQFIVVIPENEEGETGTVAAYRIAALTQSPSTSKLPPSKHAVVNHVSTIKILVPKLLHLM